MIQKINYCGAFMKKKLFTIVFVIAVLIVSILKQLLVYDLPIVANVQLGVDDALMIQIADNMVEGNWVGNYNDSVLSKGLTFPIILSFCYFIKLDYITMMTLLYTIACLVLTYVLNKKIKNKILLFAIYVIALFTPIMYSYQVMQRVYRNAIIPSMAILIIAGYIYLFFTREETKYLKKYTVSCGIGIVLALFWYTREDSIWMLPYIIFMSIALLISIIVKNKKINKEFFKILIVLLIPIVMVLAYRNILCIKNYEHFGVYTVYNNEEYNKAMKNLKKVKKHVYYDNIDYPVEKLKRVAEVTCLGQVYETLEGLIYGYSQFDSSPVEGEVANGWFPWAFKGALNSYGYYSKAENTNLFFSTLNRDIEKAFENGTLEKEDKRPDIVLSIKKVLYQTLQTFKAIYKYDDIYFAEEPTEYAENYDEIYENFAKYTNNNFIVDAPNSNENKEYIEEMNEYRANIQPKVDIINKLINIYRILTVIVFTLGIVLYAIYSIITFIQILKKKFGNLEMWVVISGVLGAMLTLVLGIAYETAFNAYVITAMYLSAAYPLMLIFGTLMIGYSIIQISKFVKNKKQKTLDIGTQKN